MIKRTFVLVMVGVLTIAIAASAQAQLRGHGGPVRALAVSPDGMLAVSGSFDTSAIRWSLEGNAAVEVLRFHEGAVNAVAYKGCRVEIVGFRSNTAPKLIDVADCFIDLGEIADRVRKEFPHGLRYEDRYIHVSRQPPPPASFIEPVMTQVAPPCSAVESESFHPTIGSVIEASDAVGSIDSSADFIRVTDDQ